MRNLGVAAAGRRAIDLRMAKELRYSLYTLSDGADAIDERSAGLHFQDVGDSCRYKMAHNK